MILLFCALILHSTITPILSIKENSEYSSAMLNYFRELLPYRSPRLGSKVPSSTTPVDFLKINDAENVIPDLDDGTSDISLLAPFGRHFLHNLNSSSSSVKLANCCRSDKLDLGNEWQHICLTSPLPVCPSKGHLISFTGNTNQSHLFGCCELRAMRHWHKDDNQEDNHIKIKEVHMQHMSTNSSCACLLIKDSPCKLLIADRKLKWKCESKLQDRQRSKHYCCEKIDQMNLRLAKGDKAHGRLKRSTLSNPMIFPTFRHINERKRNNAASNSNSKLDMNMQIGMSSGNNGNWTSQMGSSYDYDDFRRRFKREVHVMMTRYRKGKQRSRKRSRKSKSTRRPSKYFDEDLDSTPYTFLNVSFTGYTEKKKKKTTKKPRTKEPLKMTKDDLEFVHGKKKKEPKFEAVLEDPTSLLRVRVEK